MRGHFLPKVPKPGDPFQDERETLDSLLILVTDEMDPWKRVESHTVQKTMRAVNPKAWTPCVNTVHQHDRVVKTECKTEVHTWLDGEKVAASFDTWTDLTSDTLVVVCNNQFNLTCARSDKISFAFG